MMINNRSRLIDTTLFALLLVGLARASAAQCSDGTLGPCGRLAGPIPIDAKRIAILPFRTTGLEARLAPMGAGFAELLSAEFNGEIGPAAVEPGETHRAWERAGGAREAISQSTALDIARKLGAGQLLVGSVVGTGPRKFTVAATILSVPDGTTRVARVQLEGTEDSLPAVTSTLATQLLGKGAGVTGTVSNDALREYIDGMAVYRAVQAASHCGSGCSAIDHFLRAAKLDSTFILPAYRLVLLRALFGPTLGVNAFRPSFRYMWNNRRLLGTDQRLLVEALADSNELFFRAQALPRLERAITALPNSAEAWDIIGDLYFHVGALIGRDNWAQLSHQAFLRAVDLDATLCVCANEHLADFAYLNRDAKTFAKYAPAFPWQRYLGAILKGDAAGIKAARILYARELAVSTTGASLVSGMKPEWLAGIPIPQREVDSLLATLEALASTPEQRRSLAQYTAMASSFAGRPSRAAEALRQSGGFDFERSSALVLDYAHGDSVAAENLVGRLNASEPEYGVRACNVMLSKLRRADTTGAAATLARIDPVEKNFTDVLATMRRGAAGQAVLCAQVLRGVLASLSLSGGPLLQRADSLLRYMPLNYGDLWNYDLGLAFARRREYAQAAAAVRRHARAIGRWDLPRLVIALREEGRWAALAGDTAGAINAYQQYLVYRENPEPALIPERDSVRVQLAVLERSRRRRSP
jgi:hypothetical protein